MRVGPEEGCGGRVVLVLGFEHAATRYTVLQKGVAPVALPQAAMVRPPEL